MTNTKQREQEPAKNEVKRDERARPGEEKKPEREPNCAAVLEPEWDDEAAAHRPPDDS